MGNKAAAGVTARHPFTTPTFASIIKAIFILYFASSLVYTAHRLYGAYSPSSSPADGDVFFGDGESEDQSAIADDALSKQSLRHNSFSPDPRRNKNIANWSKQKLFWSNVGGSFEPMAADYLVSKVFAGLKPSKILPYYFKSETSPKYEDITITTLVTVDRLPVLERLVRHYAGPVSVCIHVDTGEGRKEVLDKLHALMEKPIMRKYVDVHVVADRHDRQFNLWRNVARFFARTEFIMMLDVDFFLCTDIRRSVLQNPQHVALLRDNRAALVVPAFEYADLAMGIDAQTFPKEKSSLLPFYQDQRLDMFHNSWIRGHNSTDYARWTEATTTYEATEYNFSYEPYVIMNKEGIAWCDERFIGYGSNKAACLYEFYLSGMDFWVLPDDFLIHQTHAYPEQARKQERQYNRKLYQNFREEACFKYARMLLSSGQWNSTKAHNVKRECGRIAGFGKAMKSFS